MSDTVIRVENLGKKYIIGHQQQGGYKTLRDAIASSAKSLVKRFRSSDDKPKNQYEEFWALKDVSFEVKQGEVVGIIGRNGAGKSTLLKILSRITEPTTGEVRIKGRVASLLEVGTGFHPELTGRENIFLNGAILGMSKSEIKKKFDAIVDFAEVEKFLDTPVKHYSSGMYVRLAFAVAAHLEPEILIVDEVLAVGDAQFQKKCLGKIGDIATKESRSILFVSHNLVALKSLCNRSLLLESGHLIDDAETDKVVSHYLGLGASMLSAENVWNDLNIAPGNDKVRLHRAAVSPVGNQSQEITVFTPIKLVFEYWNFLPTTNLNFSLVLYDLEDVCIFNTVSPSILCSVGKIRGHCYVPEHFLNSGSYRVRLLIVQDMSTPLVDLENVATFEVHDIKREGGWFGKWIGAVRPKLDWQVEIID
ncbi:ABC transporter ATP-binding protein [Pseudanabaena sp. PCC 6802]|uniref:ABC transporter ATP-binding protein n=1 Tax=Pseudanabaena sp. PCC 6802 TaxID=118173 RepID=UPI00034AAE6A|nr:ABC transporter ATP-binding protein [Pseudanabaena sp. PCC 6802]